MSSGAGRKRRGCFWRTREAEGVSLKRSQPARLTFFPMPSYPLTAAELSLLHQAAGMAGDRLSRHENDTGVRVMETLIARLETQPSRVQLNGLQREVLGKMLMNISYDLLRADEDEQSAIAETLAERLFEDEQGETE